MHWFKTIIVGFISFIGSIKPHAQVTLAFQGGEAGSTWNYTSSGTDATAAAQAFLTGNIVAGTQSIVVGGNTGGGSCIDGGSGSGASVARFFNFEAIDITSSNQYFRALNFFYGNRLPVCVGTGWDAGEDLIFTAFHDGIAQAPVTLVEGNNNLVVQIQQNQYTHVIPPCVSTFSFNISINTNRRDELLFLDNVMLTTPMLNSGGSAGMLESQTICENQLPFNWNGLVFNQAGQQSVTFTNSFGCDSVVTYVLNVTNLVTPSFPNFGPYCAGQTIPVLPITSSNNITGSWSPAINNAVTTNYIFTPNPGQCANSTSRTIIISPNETPTFNNVGPFCAGELIIVLPITSNNGYSGSWSPAINNSSTTTYTFTPSADQCATQATMTVTIDPIITPVFQNIGPYCEDDFIPALPTSSANGISGAWSPAINNQISGNYTFTPAPNQCSTPVNLFIQINPKYTTNQTVALCQNQVPYLWNGQNLSSSGSFSVTLVSQQGCDSTVNLNLSVAPTAIINQNVQVCQSDLPFAFFNQLITAPGTYQYTTNNNSDCDTTFVLNLGITPVAPVSIVNTPIATCDSPLNIIFTIQGGQNVTQCAWSTTGQTGENCDGFAAQYNFAGCHDLVLTVSDLNGCVQTITQNNIACIYPSPNANFFINPIIAEIDDVVNLVNLSNDASTFFWEFGNNSGSNGIESPTITYQNPGDYVITLVAVNEFGCTDTNRQVVQITEPVLFYVPNTFTPDGKFFNDIFLPIMTQGFDPYQYQLTVFNRWGETVFISQHPNKGWDGTYNGQDAPDGMYIWQIEFQNTQEINEVHRGHVNLLR
jgi:gliding motility-associated-like protein